MFKKLFFLSLLIPLFLVTTGGASPDGLAQLEQAKTYQKSREYTKAEEIYQNILKEYPGTDYALKAQKGLVTLYIDSRNEAQAKAAFDKLIADFPTHPDLPGMVLEIGNKYEEVEEYEKERRIYQKIIEKYPDSDAAIQAQISLQGDLVLSHIDSGNYAEAEKALNKLVADFPGHPEVAWALHWIGDRYAQEKRYEEAGEIYQLIVEEYPGSDAAIRAQISLQRDPVLSYIDSGNYAEAEKALSKLIAGFPGHPEVAWVLHWIGDRYTGLKKYEEARKIYQLIIKDYSDSDAVMYAQIKLQRGLILSYIDSGNYAEAEKALNKLVADFPGHPELAWALHWIGDRYTGLKKYEEARKIYQLIIKDYSDSNAAMHAQIKLQRGLVLSYISSGNDAAAESAFDKLLTDFAGHPELPRAINRIEEGYYNKILAAKEHPLAEAYFKNPIKAWERVTEKFPDFFYPDPDLYYFLADCYHHLGEYEKAIEYFEKVIDNFPQHGFAPVAQLQIAREYKQLKDTGVIPESEANVKIEDAYKTLVEKYPESRYAVMIPMRKQKALVLSRIISGNEVGAEAALNKLIADFSGNELLPKVVAQIGEQCYTRAFEEESQTERYLRKAIEVWERVIAEFPHSASAPGACHFIGICYRHLGEDERAEQYFQKAIDDYPEYHRPKQKRCPTCPNSK